MNALTDLLAGQDKGPTDEIMPMRIANVVATFPEDQREEVLAEIAGATGRSAETISVGLTRLGVPVSETTIKLYRRNLRRQATS